MKVLVAVCIFDRHENMRRWLHAWNMCDKFFNAELLFINNKYTGLDEAFWADYCRVRNAHYITRPNIGFETGVIEDLFQSNIEYDWDYLIFVTDDTIPIRKDFIERYVSKLESGVGVSFMEASGVVTPHIRTTGFCIRREVAKELSFPQQRNGGRVTTKDDCYHFEHRGGQETLMAQILLKGLRAVQVENLAESSLWDTHVTHFNRWDEWHREFPGYNG